MARTPREVITIVLDVGESCAKQICSNGKSYLENARSCISMIVQRKLFTKKNDLLGLFVMSSEKSVNSLDYENIELLFPMSTASWNLLKYIEKDIKSTKLNGDWLNAIIVAMQYTKDEMDATCIPISGKKLLLFTNFASLISDDEEEVKLVVNGLKTLGIDLVVIGPSVIETTPNGYDMKMKSDADLDNGQETSNGVKSEQQEGGEALISKIITDVGGLICSFEDAIPELQYYEAKKTKPAPWNIVMDIGPDIKIPVTSYKMISPVSLPTWEALGHDNEVVEREQTYVKQDVSQTPVSKNDTIPGYTFGSTIVPFSDADEAGMKYSSGGKCLSVVGFTKRSCIATHMLAGDGVYYVVSRPGDENASVAMSALIHALHDSEMVAVARKVTMDRYAPHMGALIPKIKEKYECLIFLELPYSEDLRHYVFPSLSKTKPTPEQFACIDSLIDGMDLMTAVKDNVDGPSEALHPKHTVNPYHQHFYQSLCDRALNPSDPVPPVRQSTLDLITSPFVDDKRVQQCLKDIKEKFSLVEIKQKEVRKTAADMFKREADEVATTSGQDAPPVPMETTMEEITSKIVVQIGTVDPVKDFNLLLEGKQDFISVAKQMGDVVINLVLRSFGADDFGKAASALKELRSKCISRANASLYNDFVTEMKEKILLRGKSAFWEIVVQDKIGKISSVECQSSNVDEDAVAKFYIISLQEEEVENPSFVDAEDLLNEM